jgi:cation transport ATPase
VCTFFSPLLTPHESRSSYIDPILDRPVEQRRTEFRYRCAQAVIFGLPVLGLQVWGHSLGGSPEEAQRWVALLEALLSGWVTYVGAAGLLVEGIATLAAGLFRPVLLADSLVAIAAMGLYLFSAISTLGIFLRGRPMYHPLMFHWVVIVLAIWCCGRWTALRAKR